MSLFSKTKTAHDKQLSLSPSSASSKFPLLAPSPSPIEPEYVPHSPPRSPEQEKSLSSKELLLSVAPPSVTSHISIDEFGSHFSRPENKNRNNLEKTNLATCTAEMVQKASPKRNLKVQKEIGKPSRLSIRSKPAPMDIKESKNQLFIPSYSCNPCDFRSESPNTFHLHLISDGHFNVFGIAGLVLYCTFCKHFAINAHNFKTHLCSKRHVKNVFSRQGLRYN